MEGAGFEADDELDLIRRAAAGDHGAFRLLVLAYEPRLLAYLSQMLGDVETACDVAQDTFLAAFRALPRWRPPEQLPASARQAEAVAGDSISGGVAATPRLLSPWLYRIATNRALSLLRARPERVARLDAATAAREPATAAGSSLEDRYAARDLLQAALRQLAAEDAACLVLHFVAGERYGEIAARLGISGEAVRKRIARALVALRAAYKSLDVEVPV
jgi:RNA polymerase sigma-70 factor (ECF subfamily)